MSSRGGSPGRESSPSKGIEGGEPGWFRNCWQPGETGHRDRVCEQLGGAGRAGPVSSVGLQQGPSVSPPARGPEVGAMCGVGGLLTQECRGRRKEGLALQGRRTQESQ